MTKEEALDLALEALEANQPVNYCLNSKGEKFPMLSEDPFKFERNAEAITAIKQARSAPVQEFVCSTGLCHYKTAAQRQWVGLTDDELELLNDCGDTDSYKFARAIEAKLKEKNT